MTFKQEMQDLAHELIVEDKDFSTVAFEVVHKQPSYETYDEEFGDIYNYNVEQTLVAIIGPFTETKSNAQDVLLGDLQMIVPFIDVEGEFHVNVDSIIIPDGTEYTIINKTKDASEATYILQLRKANGEVS